jgi:signal peptidase II
MVVHNIDLHEKISVIPGFFYLTYVTNKGAAWGILQGHGWLLLAVALLVSVLMFAFLRWLTEGWIERYLCVFIIFSGIIGNSIDRVWRREVVDFLDFIVWPSFKHGAFSLTSWPAFNIADSAICVGVIVYFISVYFREASRKKVKPEKRAEDQNI